MLDTILTYLGATIMALGILVVIVCFVIDGYKKLMEWEQKLPVNKG